MGCGSRLEQGLSTHITCYQRTTGPQFAIQVSGCYCYRSNKGVPEVAKLTAVTALKPNADYGVQLMVSKRLREESGCIYRYDSPSA